MSTWIAFLRAVNVGKRQYPMAQLRTLLTAAGYGEVATHIQTGNVLIESPLRSRIKLEAELEGHFARDRGFEVATIVLTPKELTAVAADVEALSAEHAPGFGHYISLLKHDPTAADVARMEGLSIDGERVIVRGRAAHLLYDVPYHRAKTSGASIEKAFGVATNRNNRVILALAEKWGA